jgi:predicted transcriptional regulator
MPAINVEPRTYEALERIASRSGADVHATLEAALAQFISIQESSDQEYQRAWDELLASIREKAPKGISPDEIDSDINAATDELWAEQRARGR